MIHNPEKPNGDAIVLTHGAGGNCNGPLLVAFANAFAEAGYLVLRYDLPFRAEGKASPPHPSNQWRDRDGVRKAVASVREMVKGRVIAGGHSYGGRQTAMTAAESADLIDAVVLFSYPLHAPGKQDQKRTDYFPSLRAPVLFVHGTKDPFGSVEDLREAMKLIPSRTDLLVVDGAGHDLKKAGKMTAEIVARLSALLS